MGLVDATVGNASIIMLSGVIVTGYAAVLLWRMDGWGWSFFCYAFAVLTLYWYGEVDNALVFLLMGEASFPYPYDFLIVERPGSWTWFNLGILGGLTAFILVLWHRRGTEGES